MRVDSIIEGMLAGQNKGLWIMAGTAMCKTETGKDSRYAPDGRQRMDPHGFHFLENGIGAVGAAPVITVEPYDCDDFFDFTLAEGSAVYRHC